MFKWKYPIKKEVNSIQNEMYFLSILEYVNPFRNHILINKAPDQKIEKLKIIQLKKHLL